ncbi:hypothetical protein FOL47_001014 [Perkinsus chesapeaki]|uniref:Methyltransferase FkbM domain-containing protein n=1 Tax=Perkinsus chesapeaki TaxID=330153 RepID=A0A7J6MKC1_PERCH|nr:hypothetical protein FOL47_001014 [Perkinsus chesapeaki]
MSLVIGIDPIEARIIDPLSVPLSTQESHKLSSVSYAAECLPLADILKATDSQTVDVLFLDAEGSEVAILDSYNFSAQPKIRVIVVEASDPRKYVELEQIFYRNGYVKTAVLGGDWVFAKLEDSAHVTAE